MNYSEAERNWLKHRYNLGINLPRHLMIASESTRSALRQFLAKLLQDTQQTPQSGSLPLLISGQACGAIYPEAAQVLNQNMPEMVDDGVFVLGLNKTRSELNEQLLSVAQCLYRHDCLPKWRDELLDVWSGSTSLGAVERGAVRALGLATRAVHLQAWSESGHLWVARRALDKATDPGLWDTLVGGLVGYAEGDDLALVRESAEEAGLDEPALANRTPIRCLTQMRRRLPEGFQSEAVLVSECVLAPDVTPCNQDGEVMTIECLPPSVVAQMLLEREFTVEASIVIAQELLGRLDKT